jgi:multiple sugar transport system substrate-binding protein
MLKNPRRNSMKKYTAIICFLVLACMLFASGGGEKAKATGKPFEGTSINVANMLGWPVIAPLWDKVGQFKEESGITVNVQSLPMAQLRDNQVQDAVQHTGTFDVYLLPAGYWALMSEYVVPIEDFVKKEGWNLEDYKNKLSAPAEDFMYDGKLMYTVANGMGVQCGYYRKELFEDPKEKQAFKAKYGYELAAPKTIQQLVDIGKFFTRDTNGDGQIDLWGLLQCGKFNHGYTMFSHQIKNSNLDIINDDYKCTWGKDYPEARAQALKIAQHNQDIIWRHKITPSEVVGMQMAELSQLWFAGKGAMIVGWVHDIWGKVKTQEVKDKIGESVSFVYPKWVAGAPSFGGGWGWGINADSKNPDAAWEFLKFAHREDIQKYMSQNSTAIYQPAFADLYKWAADNFLIPPAFAQETKLVRMRIYPEAAQVTAVIRTLHEKLMANQITPEQFIDTSAVEVDKILAKRKK